MNTTSPITFRHPSATALMDFETYIYGASDISSFGDLSNLYPKQVRIDTATKLKSLHVGNRHTSYYNPNLTSLVAGNNLLLEELTVSNCPNLVGTLDISGCSNIKRVYAEGSGISSLALPRGGYVTELALPSTLTTLSLNGQKDITTDGLMLEDYRSVKNLTIDNCPNIDTVEFLNRCVDDEGNFTVNNARLTNVNLGNVTVDFLVNKLSKIKCITPNGTVDNHRSVYIEGTCFISTLTGSELAMIKSLFPYLIVHYNTLFIENIVFVAYAKQLADRDAMYGVLTCQL
jgi:hypothetical protein